MPAVANGGKRRSDEAGKENVVGSYTDKFFYLPKIWLGHGANQEEENESSSAYDCGHKQHGTAPDGG